MAAGGMSVDEFDLAQLGVTISSDLTGWRHSVARLHRSRSFPGRLAETRLTTKRTGSGRLIVARGAQEADDLATLKARRDELLYRLDRVDTVQIELADEPDRHFNARLNGPVEIEGVAPSLTQTAHRLQIPLYCEDPRAYSDTEDNVSVPAGSGDVAIPLGTAPVEPSVAVDQTTFTLTLKNSSGVTVATLQISGASAQPVTIDMLARTITSSGGSEIDALASGDFFAIDPQDGDYVTSTWPTLAVSAGTATVTFRKAYL